LSVAGFVLMLLAFLYGASTWRQRREATEVSEPGVGRATDLPAARRGRGKKLSAPPSPKRSMVKRFEERWDRRRDGLGGGATGQDDDR
jgi:hypothetical protein